MLFHGFRQFREFCGIDLAINQNPAMKPNSRKHLGIFLDTRRILPAKTTRIFRWNDVLLFNFNLPSTML